MARSLPSLSAWLSTNPIAVDEASVERINSFDVSGRARIGGEIKAFFNFSKVSKAVVHSLVHLNGLFLWSSWFNGFVIFEYPRIKRL